MDRHRGGDTWDWLNQYLAGMNSHFDIANCINGNTASDPSYCPCSNLCNNGGGGGGGSNGAYWWCPEFYISASIFDVFC